MHQIFLVVKLHPCSKLLSTHLYSRAQVRMNNIGALFITLAFVKLYFINAPKSTTIDKTKIKNPMVIIIAIKIIGHFDA